MQQQTDLNTTEKLWAFPGNFPLRLFDSVMIDRRRLLCRRKTDRTEYSLTATQ